MQRSIDSANRSARASPRSTARNADLAPSEKSFSTNVFGAYEATPRSRSQAYRLLALLPTIHDRRLYAVTRAYNSGC